MAQPIALNLAPRNRENEIKVQLQQAPLDHGEAVLAGYEVLQALHDRGVLELARGVLGGSDKVLGQVTAVISGPEAIRATRNLLLLVRVLGDIQPALLNDLTRAIPKALVQANVEEAKPPGLMKLISTFWNRDFRRGLAAFNDLLVVFGKNLTEKNLPH